MKVLVISTSSAWAKYMDTEDYIRDNIQVKELMSRYSEEILLIDSDLLDVMQEVRRRAGELLHIACSHRTNKHNSELGSKDTSTHILGSAVDCHINSYTSFHLRQLFLKVAKELKPNRNCYAYQIGSFSIHFDFRHRVLSRDDINGTSLLIKD